MSLRNDQPPQAPLDAASLLLGLSTLHVDLSDIRTPEELLMDLRNSERTETLTEVDGPSRWEHRLCEGITSPIINDAPSSTTSNPLEVATKEGPSSEFLTAVFVALRSPVTKDRVREQLQTKTVQYLDIQDLEGSPSQDIQIWRWTGSSEPADCLVDLRGILMMVLNLTTDSQVRRRTDGLPAHLKNAVSRQEDFEQGLSTIAVPKPAAAALHASGRSGATVLASFAYVHALS